MCQSEGRKDVRLRLLGPLDRESVSRYTAVVMAVDGGQPQHSASLVVNVVVTDSNDNTPQFDRSTTTTFLCQRKVATPIYKVNLPYHSTAICAVRNLS